MSPLTDGKPYRINQLVEMLGKSRPTIEKYIERFSLERVTVEYGGKTVQAVVFTAENIKQIMGRLQTVDQVNHEPSVNDYEPTRNPDAREPAVYDERLRAAEDRIEGLKALLEERQKLIDSKENEIATLKTSLLILERNNQQMLQGKQIELIPASSGGSVVGRLKNWFIRALSR